MVLSKRNVMGRQGRRIVVGQHRMGGCFESSDTPSSDFVEGHMCFTLLKFDLSGQAAHPLTLALKKGSSLHAHVHCASL